MSLEFLVVGAPALGAVVALLTFLVTWGSATWRLSQSLSRDSSTFSNLPDSPEREVLAVILQRDVAKLALLRDVGPLPPKVWALSLGAAAAVGVLLLHFFYAITDPSSVGIYSPDQPSGWIIESIVLPLLMLLVLIVLFSIWIRDVRRGREQRRQDFARRYEEAKARAPKPGMRWWQKGRKPHP